MRQLPSRSHFFTLRVWLEEVDNAIGIRGKLQHVFTGEAKYFRDWEGLIEILEQHVSSAEKDTQNDLPAQSPSHQDD